MLHLLETEFLLPRTNISKIWFYGAGCAFLEKNRIVANALTIFFEVSDIHINSDLIAGKLSDNIAKKNPARRMMLQGLGLLVAAPFIFMMGNATILLAIYIGFVGFGFARAFFDANTYAVLYDIVPPKYHSSASGVMIMSGFGVGSLAPLVLGYIKSGARLSTGISLLAVIWLVCGMLMLLTSKYFYVKDLKKSK